MFLFRALITNRTGMDFYSVPVQAFNEQDARAQILKSFPARRFRILTITRGDFMIRASA